MNQKPNEKDWKVFKKIAPELRERYLHAQNEEFASILNDNKLTQTEQFWEIEERTRKTAKVLRDSLDGHTRSKMEFFMLVMLSHGMMTKDDLAEFSEEVRERLLQCVA